MSTGSTYHSAQEAGGRNKWGLPVALGVAVLVVLLLVWLLRGKPELHAGYGRRTGAEHRDSVNGTMVLSEMFRQRGHSVTSVDRLSPKLRKYKTLIWAPDDFGLPTTEQREFLEQWMNEHGGTVVYIGRDYDAATAYWTRILPQAPAEQKDEVQRKLADAKSRFAQKRAQVPKNRYARWFVVRDGTPKKVTTLEGVWAAGVDAKKCDITLASRFDEPTEKDRVGGPPLPEFYDPLLTSEGDHLVARVSDYSWGSGKVIVVTNGSMFLNYPLINHENRKLAGKLITECGDGDVAFVESGANGPPVEYKSTEKREREWPFPLNAIVFHLVMLSLVYCLARTAIFGRARTLPAESPSDFGKHIQALGKLMQRTKDQAYAYARLQQYRQHGKRDSGKAHKK